jgi:hypothetical protein
MSKEKQAKLAFERCMELVQQGVDAKDAEYQELYVALNPDSRTLVDSARRMMPKLRIEEDARQAAAAIREAIAPGGKLVPQQMWAPCAPMPTDMCRVSPFFPLRQHDMKERPFVRGIVITSNSWGEIKYTGPKLSTYEEDVLLAVLALLDGNKNRHVDEVEGKSTYTYRGPLLPVLRLMGYTGKSYGRTDYTRVVEALKLMTVAGIELNIFGRNSRGKRKVSQWLMTQILSVAYWHEERKELTVTVNPYFCEMFVAGTVTLLDVIERAKLRSPIAKSLMRFMQSQRNNQWGPAHYLTLTRTLNLDLDQPAKQIRRLLKGAIDELLKSGWLSAGGFESKDLVSLTRADKSRKLLEK